MRLMIDTDAGVDDAQALLMAFAHPGTTVEAITTVTGNTHVDKVVANVFTALHFGGRKVPVYRGADRPLIAEWFSAEYLFGSDGLGEWPERPPVSGQVEPEHAAQAMVRLANQFPGELTLLALGPLTNIALAVHLDPTFPSKIRKFIFMGGTIAAQGNTPNVTAEYNIYVDPEAAYMTLRAFPDSVMISWETTIQHPISEEQYQAWVSASTDRARFIRGISARVAAFLQQLPIPPTGHLLPDPLAMAVALEPPLVKKSQKYFVSVELQGALTRGQTVIDYRASKGISPNVEVVTEVDMEGVLRLLKQSVS